MAAYGREMKLLLSLCPAGPAAVPPAWAWTRAPGRRICAAVDSFGLATASRCLPSSRSFSSPRCFSSASPPPCSSPLPPLTSRSSPTPKPRTCLLQRLGQRPQQPPLQPPLQPPSRRWFGIKTKLVRPATEAEQKKIKSTIVTDYEDLPSDYRDTEGLPFLEHDRTLSEAEVRTIFGKSIKASAANQLLMIIQGRRVAGTLEDPRFWPNTAAYGDEAVDAALAHLRQTLAVDEVMNAGLRAQDELDEMDREMQREAAAQGKAEPVPEPDPIYGYNKLDTARQRNNARAEAKEKREKEEREAKGLPPAMGPLEILRQPRELSPRMQRWTQLATSTMDEPPEMSHWERLGPSVAFFVLFIGGLALLTLVYTPPSDRYRLFPLVTPAQATVGALVLANLVVWCCWRAPPLWGIMNRYFFIVHGLPRVPSLVLSIFSHQALGHLCINMSVLWFFGTKVHDEVGGRAAFLTLYLGAGMFGMLVSMAWFVLRGVLVTASLGASGATYGVMGAYFWQHRTDTFKIGGLPPDPFNGVPGVVFLALLAGANLGSITKIIESKVDKFSHVAGAAFGIACLEFIRSRLGERGVEKTEGEKAEGGTIEGEMTEGEMTEGEMTEGEEDTREWIEWNIIDLATGTSTIKRELRKKSDQKKEAARIEQEAARTKQEEVARTIQKEVVVTGQMEVTGADQKKAPKTPQDKQWAAIEEERERQRHQARIRDEIRAQAAAKASR